MAIGDFKTPPPNGHLYYVRLKTIFGKIYKIGFTSLESVEARFSFKKNEDENLIDRILFFQYFDNALEMERILHRHFSERLLFPGKQDPDMPLFMNGQSELYSEDILVLDSDYSVASARTTKESILRFKLQKANRTPELIEAEIRKRLDPQPPPKTAASGLFASLLHTFSAFFDSRVKSDSAKTIRKHEEAGRNLVREIHAQAHGFLIPDDYDETSLRHILLQRKLITLKSELDQQNTLVGKPALKEHDEKIRSPDGARLVSALNRAGPGQAPDYVALTQALDVDLIGEFSDSWDWALLSASKSICWSVALINRFADKLNWHILSRNEFVPWSDYLIDSFSNRLDWSAISENTAVPWTSTLIAKYHERWEWSSLSENNAIPFEREIIQRFIERWDWYLLSGNEAIPFTPQLIENFQDRWDWNWLSQNEALRLSLEMIDQYADRLYWPFLSGRQDLPWSAALIKRYEERWNWERLADNESLPWSIELIELFADKWVVESTIYKVGGFAHNEALPWSLELIRRFEHRLCWIGLSANKALPWSPDLISRYLDRWHWPTLSRNTALPWSTTLIEQFEDLWDWGDFESGLSGNNGVPWSEDLIKRFHERVDGTWLASNNALPWSEKLIEQLQDKLSWNFLSRNKALPWSISLIEKFADRWFWGSPGLSENEAIALPALSRSQIIEVMCAHSG